MVTLYLISADCSCSTWELDPLGKCKCEQPLPVSPAARRADPYVGTRGEVYTYEGQTNAFGKPHGSGTNLAFFLYVQTCAEKRDCFAKHQPGMAGCGWLQPGRNFLSTWHHFFCSVLYFIRCGKKARNLDFKVQGDQSG